MHRSSVLVLGLLLIAVALYSCSKKPGEKTPLTTAPNALRDGQREYLVSVGFPEGLIEERGDLFVIGDMAIAKSDVPSAPLRSATLSEQRRNLYLVTPSLISGVRVKFDTSVLTYATEITAALNAWNSTGSNVHFQRDDANPQVTIYLDNSPSVTKGYENLPAGVCGLSALPSSLGDPGHTVSLNHTSMAAYSSAQRQFNVTHELGHTIGFRHTDDGTATLIVETLASDPSSVMNSGYCGHTNLIDTWDNNSCHLLYPDAKVSSGTNVDLDVYHAPYGYTLPGTLLPSAIVGMDISAGDSVFAWYSDGTVSSGASLDLDRVRTAYSYSLPPGPVG